MLAPRWTSHRRLLEQKLADLHRCSNPSHLKQVHAQILKSNLHSDPFVAPKLIASYSLCRLPASSAAAFRHVPHPNTHLYNTLIRALAHNSLPSLAFAAYLDMLVVAAAEPDNFTYPFLLKACSDHTSVKIVHTHILKSGFHLSDVFVPNALVDAYSKSGSIASARKVFDKMYDRDIVSYNSMLAGLVRAGEVRDARRMFDDMRDRDLVTWNTVLDGHAKAGEMDEAFKLFERMPERNVVSWTTVVSGYCKRGDMDMARMLFDRMPVKNLVSWTIMVAGYAVKGFAKEASRLLDRMVEAGFEPDEAAVVSVLAGCAESGLLGLGKRIHAYIDRSRLRYATQVCNALVDMYAKCGNLDKAQAVFEGMTNKDLVSWNSIVQSLAIHGRGELALELFGRMQKDGIRPDGVTFIGVLCACTHGGLIEEARRYFSSMKRDYGIIPQVEHYGCMIDVLGRGGLLQEAYDLAKSMPWEPNVIIWGTLLGASRMHNNVDIAEEVVDRLVGLEPLDAGNYSILSNIYAAAGQWDGVAKARKQMKAIGTQKPSGSSWIELNDVVHEFTVADRSHSQSERILGMVGRLGNHLKQVGYVPKAYG